MVEKIQLRKTVLEKQKYSKVVNTNFTTFTEDVAEESITVEEFFIAYENLYYEIPVLGASNSHEYLIRRSSELVDIDSRAEDIQRYLDEIARLREQLLEANQLIAQLKIDNAVDSVTNG